MHMQGVIKRFSFSLILVIILIIGLTGCEGIDGLNGGDFNGDNDYYTLTMNISGEGLVEPEVGEYDYEAGAIVNISAEPAEGWSFKEWSGEVQNSTAKETTVNMTGNISVTAVFEKDDDLNGEFYEVSGKVLDGRTETGIQDIVLSFGEEYTDEVTDSEGNWSKSGLLEEVTITPLRNGLGQFTTFSPRKYIVDNDEEDIIFFKDVELFNNNNILAVADDPPNPTEFILTDYYLITHIRTYHWNSGSGKEPGTIALEDEDGVVYGPWEADEWNSNRYWYVEPDIELGPGQYRVIDSDNSTWSHNNESENRGFAYVGGLFVKDGNGEIDDTEEPGDSDISEGNSNAFVSGDIEYNNDFTEDITLDRDIEISIVDLIMTIELKDYNGDPLPDDDYQVKIESDIEGVIFEDENLRFSSGDGSIDLDLVIIAQGQHTLTVEVDGLVIENNLNLNIEASNLVLNGGSIDLNGYELIVNGNIYQGGGDITINNGSLIVNGDFRLQKRNDNNEFDFDRSSGRLVMVESDDYVLINGNFITESTRSHSNSLIKGVIEFKGDFEQIGTNAAYGNYSRSNFDSNEDHKVIFSGESTQSITFESTSVSGFQLVELKNSALNFNSPLRISELDMNAVINNSVNYGFSDEMDFAGNSLIIKGDYIQTANVEIDLNSGFLEVEGDFYQTRGTLEINKGRLEVKGDYRLQSLEHERVPARLNMLDTDDYVLVEGDFVTHSYSTHVNSLEAGTMELKGDFSQLGTSGMYGYFERSNFSASDDHLVIFSGDKRQNISFESDIHSGFNRAIFDNADINLKTSVKGWRLEEDTVISNNIEHGFTENFNLDGYSLIIDGDFYMKADGTVNFNNGMMHVKGDLYQARGEFDINGGMLAVDGDYRIQSLDNKRVPARLIMLNKDDYIVVKSDFVMHSYRSHGSSLEAGVLEIKGDFSQLGTSASFGYFERSNFSASEDHIVVLSGDSQQNISFASSGHSQFATLIVVNETGNRIVYNTKYNLSRYSNVELNYSSLELDLNQSVQVNAEFTMEPNQTAIWSSRDSSVASVSNNGVVSGEGSGVTGIKIANSGDQSLLMYLFVEVE